MTFSGLILKIMGWKVPYEFPPETQKCVLIEAPHTSSWDFVIGKLVSNSKHLKSMFFIKKEFFKPPFGFILKRMGGISIDRGKKNNMVESAVKLLNEMPKLTLSITPEGTRKLSKNWKKGFYLIAMEAKVPIVFGYIDYAKKEAGAYKFIYPSGDYDADMKIIEDFYKDISAKFPENFNLSPIYRNR